MTNGPLAGVQVVELAGLGPAPCAGMMFADMGADVILIDRKGAAGFSPESKLYNRGKRSITLDLKSSSGVEVCTRLINQADVLIEGFRPGVMEKLGLGPDEFSESNPALVYGRLTGWGQHGPLAPFAGHDPNYIAISGALWHGGSDSRPPAAPLTLVGDFGGGTMLLCWGIMCALTAAKASGQGQVVDAAISDGSALNSILLWAMKGRGDLPDDLGASWQNGAAPWNNTYECLDGKFVTVCALESKFYLILTETLGLARDPDFADQWDTERWPSGKTKLRKLFAQKSRDEWTELLELSDACFSPVLSLDEAFGHSHNQARHVFEAKDGFVHPSPAPKLSAYDAVVKACPVPGEHCTEILRESGFTDRDLERLARSGTF